MGDIYVIHPYHTVDGRNPAPVDMEKLPLFTGFLYIPGGAGFLPSPVSIAIMGKTQPRRAPGGEVQAEFQHWRKAVAQRYPDKEMVEVENVFGRDESWLSCVELGWLEALLLEAEKNIENHRNEGTPTLLFEEVLTT